MMPVGTFFVNKLARRIVMGEEGVAQTEAEQNAIARAMELAMVAEIDNPDELRPLLDFDAEFGAGKNATEVVEEYRVKNVLLQKEPEPESRPRVAAFQLSSP